MVDIARDHPLPRPRDRFSGALAVVVRYVPMNGQRGSPTELGVL